MYIWKLEPILNAEGGVNKVVEKARRAKLSAIWIKIADGKSPFSNITGDTAAKTSSLIEKCNAKNIEVWGWQVPHCASKDDAKKEADRVRDVLNRFHLDGIIMDAEGGGAFFQGGSDEADIYARSMREVADDTGKKLAISSNDIPQNLPGWLPKFNKIASVADLNFPQVYYGGSPSVVNRFDRAEAANSHVTIPFMPVGAAWIGVNDGGCSSASACAERATQFIDLVHARDHQAYAFWHWAGAPLPFWEVLNGMPV
jgi:hypothetical protein